MIYLLGVYPSFTAAIFTLVGVVFGYNVVTEVYRILLLDKYNFTTKDRLIVKGINKSRKSRIVFLSIVFGLYVLTPPKETVYALVGVKVGEEIVEQPKVQELLGDSYDLLRTTIQKYAKDMKGESSEKPTTNEKQQ